MEAKVGQVKVEKPVIDYLAFTPKDPELDDDQYGHLVEIYDFDPTIKTADISRIFIPAMLAYLLLKNHHVLTCCNLLCTLLFIISTKDLDIKWVDDTHAIGIFSSSVVAQDALLYQHPMIKTCPISQASRLTKVKAKSCCGKQSTPEACL